MQSLPIGTIIMYDGANWMDNVTLTGWYACTGSNAAHGCPDLQARFIKGGTVGETGGSNERALSVAQLPAHNHAVTVNSHTHSFSGANHSHGFSTPNHSHAISGQASGLVNRPVLYTALIHYGIDPPLAGSNVGVSMIDYYTNESFSLSGGTDTSGGGSGTTDSAAGGGTVGSTAPVASSANTGSGQAFDNQPAYYSVIFVRKCYETATQSMLSYIAENFDDSGTVTNPATETVDGGDIETAFTFRDAGRL